MDKKILIVVIIAILAIILIGLAARPPVEEPIDVLPPVQEVPVQEVPVPFQPPILDLPPVQPELLPEEAPWPLPEIPVY